MIHAIKNPTLQWAAIGGVCIALMDIALVYEYALDALPCVMCIQVRLLISAAFVISVCGIVFQNRPRIQMLCWLSLLSVSIALIERSWQLLASERGWVIPDCGIPSNPGLPGWFALHEWLPSVFRPETTCGASPEMLFGVTMTEWTMVFSVGFATAAISGLVVSGFRLMSDHG